MAKIRNYEQGRREPERGLGKHSRGPPGRPSLINVCFSGRPPSVHYCV